jgi:flagellar FliJ protein
MAKTFPFQILRDLAQESLQHAYEAVGQALAQERDAKEQMDKLQQYRYDYLQKLQNTLQSGMRSSAASNAQRFIDNIDHAIAQQQVKMKALIQNTAHKRQEWALARRKVESMSTLLARQDRKLETQADRLEQKQNDEYAARTHLRMQMA